MSLEEALAANTAAVVALDAKMAAFMKSMPTTTAPAADTKADTKATTTKKDKAPAVTFEEMKTSILKLKDAKGKEAAESIIKDVGGAEKMAGIAPAKFAAVMAAVEAALAEPEKPAEDDL